MFCHTQKLASRNIWFVWLQKSNACRCSLKIEKKLNVKLNLIQFLFKIYKNSHN